MSSQNYMPTKRESGLGWIFCSIQIYSCASWFLTPIIRITTYQDCFEISTSLSNRLFSLYQIWQIFGYINIYYWYYYRTIKQCPLQLISVIKHTHHIPKQWKNNSSNKRIYNRNIKPVCDELSLAHCSQDTQRTNISPCSTFHHASSFSIIKYLEQTLIP